MTKEKTTGNRPDAAAPPSTESAIRHILAATAEALPFPPPSHLLVALSGGADSVALLCALLLSGYKVEAAHCNFHLRGEESDRDEAFVRELCKKRGVKLHCTHFDTTGEATRTGESIEMAARRLRYAWFDQVLRQTGCEAVAVAHHANDNAETFFINMLRGTGLRGLTGMAEERARIVRPLLRLTRAEIENFLQALKQDFVTDSTNKDTAYRRNKIRHEVMPLLRTINPAADRTLSDTMRHLAGAQELVDYAVAALRPTVARTLPDGLRIDIAALDALPVAPGGREAFLHELLRPFGFPPSTLEDMLHGLHGQPGAFYKGSEYLAVRDRCTLEIRRCPVTFSATHLPREGVLALPNGLHLKIQRMPRSDVQTIPRTRFTACLDADTLCGQLFCRSISTGDRFRPFGMTGTKLVSDLLTERKRSRIEKLTATVVCDAGGIVWLTAERPAARCAVTENTRHILLITAEPAN